METQLVCAFVLVFSLDYACSKKTLLQRCQGVNVSLPAAHTHTHQQVSCGDMLTLGIVQSCRLIVVPADERVAATCHTYRRPAHSPLPVSLEAISVALCLHIREAAAHTRTHTHRRAAVFTWRGGEREGTPGLAALSAAISHRRGQPLL